MEDGITAASAQSLLAFCVSCRSSQMPSLSVISHTRQSRDRSDESTTDMNYRITHRTIYDYPEPVTASHHAARVKPRPTNSQGRNDFALHITPEPAAKTMRTDYFGNRVCFFSIQQIHKRLEITARSRVAMGKIEPPSLTRSPDWSAAAAMFQDPVSLEVVEP